MQKIRYATGECSLGTILVAQSEQGLCAISIGETQAELVRDLQNNFSKAALIEANNEFANTISSVTRFLEAPALGLDLPLDIHGTDFQRLVWQALAKIPAGSTLSYTDIAISIGSPKAVRAVASACAANTLAVVIPCHRVVRSDGGLSGYRWGIERKRLLLEREAGRKYPSPLCALF